MEDVVPPKEGQDEITLSNSDDEMEFLNSISVSLGTPKTPFEVSTSAPLEASVSEETPHLMPFEASLPLEANVSEETSPAPFKATNSLPLNAESSLSFKGEKDSQLSFETLVTKLKALFTTPPHEVKVEKANSLASELWQTNEEILMRIGEAIRALHPTEENVFEDLILWRKALRYEHTLREYLLDLLHRVFHGKTSEEIQREDIRSLENPVTIFRYPISGYLITNYKRFLRKSGPFPNPPKGWNELMGIPSNVRPSRNNRGKDVRPEIPSGSRSTNANFYAGNIDADNFDLRLKLNRSSSLNSPQTEDLTSPVINLDSSINCNLEQSRKTFAEIVQSVKQEDNCLCSSELTMLNVFQFADKLKEIQRKQSELTENYTSEYTRLTEIISHHEKILMEAKAEAAQVAELFQRDLESLLKQQAAIRNRMERNTSAVSTPPFKHRAEPYRQPPRDRPSQSSHSSGCHSGGHSMAHSSRSKFASFGSNTDHKPKSNRQVQPRRPTDRFPLVIVTGPHVKKLAGVAPVREAAVSLIFEEMKQKKSELAPILESIDQAAFGLDLKSGIKWDQKVLLEKFPRESPNHMGRNWSAEVSTFDVSNLNMFNLSSDVKTSLTGIVYTTLSRKVSSFEQYKAVIQHLGVLVEECSLNIILELVNNSDAVLGHVTWKPSVLAEDRKFHLASHVKLRTNEFLRELSFHLALVEDTLVGKSWMDFGHRMFANAKSTLDRLWWFANLSVPIKA